jgi:hypothetical protein
MADVKISDLTALTDPADDDEMVIVDTSVTTTKKIAFDDLAGKVLLRSGLGPYGVEWDDDDSSPTLTRLGTLAGFAAGSSPGDTNLPIQAMMRRCVVNDDGEVVYYLDPDDSTLKEDGVTASVLDGTDGQVMVEIQKFAYRYTYDAVTNKHQRWVSPVLLPGFKWHWAFYKNGAWVDHRYFSAYEGVLYDVSESIYANGIRLETSVAKTTFAQAAGTITRTDETNPFTNLEAGDKIVVSGTTNNNGTFTVAAGGTGDQTITVDETLVDEANTNAVITHAADWANDKLCSVSGKVPIVYGTRDNFRDVAAKRGPGWRQQDFDLVDAVQTLYLTEYASFYSQSVIGNGLTDWESRTWSAYNDYNPINQTGLSNGDGNATANVSNGDGVVGSYMSYRGIENFFGHLWKWVDGFNINNNIPYVSNDDTDFADDTATGVGSTYERITDINGDEITLINANDYQKTLQQTERGFLPASGGGAANTYVTDYYSQGAGWRVAQLGGVAVRGTDAGCFCWVLDGVSGYLSRNISGWLSF